MTLPAHITRHLVATGVMTADGISRRARIRPCRDCRADTVTGLDNDLAAFTAHADPQPLTPVGELAALLDGRATYELVQRHRPELDLRDSADINARPAHRATVLPAHRCHAPVPAAWLAPPPPPVVAVQLEEEPSW